MIIFNRGAASTVTLSSPQEVIINHLDDSIRLGDGSSFLTSTTVSGKVGLDVAIINVSNTFTVYTVSVPSANTEVFQALPINTTHFGLRVRGATSDLKLAFVAGQSGSNYEEVGRGERYDSPSFESSSVTLYFQTTQAAQVVTITACHRV